MKNKIMIVCTFFIFFIAGVALSRVKSMRSERKFQRDIGKRQFSVAMIYDEGESVKQDAALRSKVDRLENMFRSTSEQRDFRDAGVLFAKVDINKRDLDIVAQEYHVSKLPTFFLFRHGSLVKDKTTKQPVKLVGFVSRAQLLEFITKYLGEEIEDYAKERRRAREYNRLYWWGGYGGYGGYPYGYGGYGWPYNNYYYPYGHGYGHRGHFGFGFNI